MHRVDVIASDDVRVELLTRSAAEFSSLGRNPSKLNIFRLILSPYGGAA